MKHHLYLHGEAVKGKETPTYRSWTRMKCRCNNPHHKDYHRYGGRCIRVCEEWNSFVVFLRDMGSRPLGRTLERIDNNKGYSKSNCIWGSSEQQNNNKSNSRLLSLGGRTQTLTQWSRELGFSDVLLKYRLQIGWSFQKAITEPIRKYTKHYGT